ncbi:MAG: DNA protecting protein DprA [Candidatus Melainabacteria bacterium RIFOXYA12_FULL_32_12]|nr:MAG: DNA protecting protein DprA [Candidatus Melainabacteria bacterium RIFOXYA2_FULL_32_9]OGI31682.1 MAG: DNA protecting protein DprA [Candidatus Melainabacteria bacterium RIFOXYA12_FULL_32_12]
MSDLKYWLAFSKVNSIGSRFIKKVWEHFGSIKEAWLASNADLLRIEGLRYNRVQNFIEARKAINPDKLLEEIYKRDIKVLTLQDEDYPYLLRQIPDPPAILFIKGNLEVCNLDKTLAIVGSRKASHYILEILNKIIDEIRGTDITIVSGMALGVDSCAHKAALKNNLKTIAVLGSGLDHIYPKKNKDLFQEIINGNGAVISEYYPSEEPEPWKFPVRNRIVSALSKGTLIAEAGLKSGALITANLCLEQNRELMCIPGLITNPNTEGIHQLIKNGAGVVTNAKDIFDYLNWHYDVNTENNQKSLKIHLLDNERKIYEILSLEPITFDEILNKSQLNTQELMINLTSLELNGLIKQLPGQKYISVLS